MTLLEYFIAIGYNKPDNISKDKFLSIVELYSDTHQQVITHVEGMYLQYICPVTGEIIRQIKQQGFIHQDHKLLEDMSLIDEVNEVKELHNNSETITTYHTTRLLAELPKSQGQLILRMIDGLIYGNNGVLVLDDSDRNEYKHLSKVFKFFDENQIAYKVNNKLPPAKYLPYKIAPHIAYKGNKSKQDNEIHHWIREMARRNKHSV